ncbi:hypothetical protein Tco_0613614 [Tanacetum coccineum]
MSNISIVPTFGASIVYAVTILAPKVSPKVSSPDDTYIKDDKGKRKLNDDKGKGIMKAKFTLCYDKGNGKGKGIVKDTKQKLTGIKEFDDLEERIDNVEADLFKFKRYKAEAKKVNLT